MAEFEERGIQIGRWDAKGKILDITDLDPEIGIYLPKKQKYAQKLALNYTKYDVDTTQGQARHTHWLDVDAARLLCWDLTKVRKGDKKPEGTGFFPMYQEYKGSAAGKNTPFPVDPTHMLSRTMTVTYMEVDGKGERLRSGPVYQFAFLVCDGKEGDKGQVTPIKGGKQYLSEQINVPLFAARKVGLTVIQYLQAKLTCQFSRYTPSETAPDEHQ
jgi:hypothetical protein